LASELGSFVSGIVEFGVSERSEGGVIHTSVRGCALDSLDTDDHVVRNTIITICDGVVSSENIGIGNSGGVILEDESVGGATDTSPGEGDFGDGTLVGGIVGSLDARLVRTRLVATRTDVVVVGGGGPAGDFSHAKLVTLPD